MRHRAPLLFAYLLAAALAGCTAPNPEELPRGEEPILVTDFDFPNGSYGTEATVSNVTGTATSFRFQVNSAGTGQSDPAAVRISLARFLDAPASHGIAVLRAADDPADFGFGVQVDAVSVGSIITYWNKPTSSRSYYFDVILTR